MSYMLDNYDFVEPARWSWWAKVFSADECKRIIAIGESLGMHQAYVGGGEDGCIQLKQRNSQVAWLHYSPDFEWIFSTLAQKVFEHNRRFFGYHLTGFKEALQITKYSENNFYNWHQDNGIKNPFRKLSLVINLSSPDQYEGGELEIFGGDGGIMSKELGMMTLFPSYEQHRVRKVTKGVRYSLVTWVHGPRLV